MMGWSDISWTICKPLTLCSRQTTTPAPHQSIFTGQMLFLTPKALKAKIPSMTVFKYIYLNHSFSALTLLVGRQEGHLACKTRKPS